MYDLLVDGIVVVAGFLIHGSLFHFHDLILSGLELLPFLNLVLLKFLEMHVKCLGIVLYLFNTFDYLLLEDLLSLFDLNNLLVKGLLPGTMDPCRGRLLPLEQGIPEGVIVGELLIILELLSLVVVVVGSPGSHKLRLVLSGRLVLIALDHILEMLLHGQLTWTS